MSRASAGSEPPASGGERGLKGGEVGDAEQPCPARCDHCAAARQVGGRNAASRSAFAFASSISEPAAADEACARKLEVGGFDRIEPKARGVERQLAGAAKHRVNRRELRRRIDARQHAALARQLVDQRTQTPRRRAGQRADIFEPRLAPRERGDRRALAR